MKIKANAMTPTKATHKSPYIVVLPLQLIPPNSLHKLHKQQPNFNTIPTIYPFKSSTANQTVHKSQQIHQPKQPPAIHQIQSAITTIHSQSYNKINQYR